MTTGIGVGVDVSKDTLDVATSDESVTLHVANDAEGMARIVEALEELKVHRVLLEASGGYERNALIALYEAKLPVVLVQPLRARHFARAVGRYAKTDKIDAAMLARMAQLVVDEAPLWKPTEEVLADLKALVERRQTLVAVREAEQKRLRLARSIVRADIEAAIADLADKVGELEQRIDKILAKSKELKEEVAVLEGVKGVGRISAATLLVALPELGTLTRGEISALAGLAPMNRDSGTWSGSRFIRGGRAQARRALYMAALVASRWNPVIQERYRSLVARGKKHKVALVACMRKLLIHLNGLIRAHKNGPTNAARQLS